MNKLNFGCGKDIKEDFENVDVVPYEGVDKEFDFNKPPYPYKDNTFDEIYAFHILEHLEDFHRTISELARISKNGAVWYIKAPFFLNTKYFGDPSHKIPFSIRSFDNYENIKGKKLKFYEKWKADHTTNMGAKYSFDVLKKSFNFTNFPILRQIFNVVGNLEPVLYERLFAGIFSPEEVFFILKIKK